MVVLVVWWWARESSGRELPPRSVRPELIAHPSCICIWIWIGKCLSLSDDQENASARQSDEAPAAQPAWSLIKAGCPKPRTKGLRRDRSRLGTTFGRWWQVWPETIQKLRRAEDRSVASLVRGIVVFWKSTAFDDVQRQPANPHRSRRHDPSFFAQSSVSGGRGGCAGPPPVLRRHLLHLASTKFSRHRNANKLPPSRRLIFWDLA